MMNVDDGNMKMETMETTGGHCNNSICPSIMTTTMTGNNNSNNVLTFPMIQQQQQQQTEVIPPSINNNSNSNNNNNNNGVIQYNYNSQMDGVEPPPPNHQQVLNSTMSVSNQHPDTMTSKLKKARRYWTRREEQLLFEIWGRDNWRLPKHGKNTPFFAEWVIELKEKYNIEIKLEEIQCKVNQMRSKYRRIQRSLDANSEPPRWKKYTLIEKILNNEYHPTTIGLESFTTGFTSPGGTQRCRSAPNTPHGSISSRDPLQRMLNHRNWNQIQCVIRPEFNATNNTSNEMETKLNISGSSQNDEDLSTSEDDDGGESSTEEHNEMMVATTVNNIKEVEDEVLGEEEKNTLQQSIQYVRKYVPRYLNQLVGSKETLQKDLLLDGKHHLQQQQQQLNNSLSNCNPIPNPNSNENHTNTKEEGEEDIDLNQTTTTTSSVLKERLESCVPSNANNNKNNNNNNNNNQRCDETIPSFTIQNSQPPMEETPTKRSITTVSSHPCSSVYRIEELYLQEIREKNSILSDQRQIARERLQIEQRKLSLLENFLPKYLGLQQRILENLERLETEKPNGETVPGAQEADANANANAET